MTAPAPIVLLRRLVDMGEALSLNRATTLSDAAIRELRDHVMHHVMRPCEDVRLIGTEALCLVECMVALTYARADHNAEAESRMHTMVNALKGFLTIDLIRAEKAALQ